jgi:large subunit ribosomal protein L13
MVNFDPSSDMGGNVIVINSELVKLSGKKMDKKEYSHHTGYLGGLKTITFRELQKKNPNEIIKKAVWNMLPKNRIRNKRILRLKIYTGIKTISKI